MITYMRVLDVDQQGAGWREVSRIVLRIDPDTEAHRARRVFESHLSRARWMTEQGQSPSAARRRVGAITSYRDEEDHTYRWSQCNSQASLPWIKMLRSENFQHLECQPVEQSS